MLLLTFTDLQFWFETKIWNLQGILLIHFFIFHIQQESKRLGRFENFYLEPPVVQRIFDLLRINGDGLFLYSFSFRWIDWEDNI